MNDNILTLNNVALFWQGNFVGLAAGETTIRIKSSRSECNFAEKTGTSEANFLHRISCQAELLLRVSDAQKLFPSNGEILSFANNGRLQFAPDSAGELRLIPLDADISSGYQLPSCNLLLDSEWRLSPNNEHLVKLTFQALDTADSALKFCAITASDRQVATISAGKDPGALEELLLLHLTNTMHLLPGKEIFRYDGIPRLNAICGRITDDCISNFVQHGTLQLQCHYVKRDELFSITMQLSRQLGNGENILLTTRSGQNINLRVTGVNREYGAVESVSGVKCHSGTVTVKFKILN